MKKYYLYFGKADAKIKSPDMEMLFAFNNLSVILQANPFLAGVARRRKKVACKQGDIKQNGVSQ